MKILFSNRLTAILLLIYAIAMGVATFIENDYGTPAAKAYIYGAKWFELIMVLLIVNFIGNIKKYNLWRVEKWPLLLFHLSFIIIFIGAGITRYISYDGKMEIPEGETQNQIISSDNYFKILISNSLGEKRQYKDVKQIMAQKVSFFSQTKFKETVDYKGIPVTLETLDYFPRAIEEVKESLKGKKILHLVTMGETGRKDVYLNEGEIKNINNTIVTFNNPVSGSVQIYQKPDGKLYIKSPFDGNVLKMATQKLSNIAFMQEKEVLVKSLYSLAQAKFVFPGIPIKKGFITYKVGDKTKEQNSPDMVIMRVSTPTKSDTIKFYGGSDKVTYGIAHKIEDLTINIGYGSVIYKTPFSVKLNDFQLDKYPGSSSASSYKSQITIIDKKNNINQDHEIFMNNVLDYGGFRLFQSSYFPDETGTVLSVNHDVIGTSVSYLGYAMLFFGLVSLLFWRSTHFTKLNNQLKQLVGSKKTLILFLVFSTFLTAQNAHSKKVKPEDIKGTVKINEDHANKFGRLLIQDVNGRISPINTVAIDILRKIYKKDNFYGLNANQWMISIIQNPVIWGNTPLIKVGMKGGDELKKITNADENGYTTITNLFKFNQASGEPTYVLADLQKKIFAKKASDQTNFDKEVIAVDERLQILTSIINGQYIRIIPIKNELNNTWTSWITPNFTIDATAAKFFKQYFTAVEKGQLTGDWKDADLAIKDIGSYQEKWGKNIIPSKFKIELEVFYNQLNLFFWLMIAYTILGSILLIFSFIQVFSRGGVFISKAINYLFYLLIGLFSIHALGLAARWFISGHAPWSNGYEAVIFISWVGILSGILLYKNRNTFIPTAGIFVAVILMGFAQGSSLLDPQITPLVPVLKSYWLMIHVAIITSSYAFFGLGALLSVIVLILYLLPKNKNTQLVIKELSIVNELSLTVGIINLTIGTFLGGIWANESWGRYWSWDPKETWAFISVIIYATVLHLRLIPALKNFWVFNIASMWAISTIVMTYFGVNYYLSGLHSYAAGDPIPIPNWVYISTAFGIFLSIFSYFGYKNKIN
ncbi:MAG: cytochrome c biogenesis protein CcsA [Solirubrobacteraceae bacterium]